MGNLLPAVESADDGRPVRLKHRDPHYEPSTWQSYQVELEQKRRDAEKHGDQTHSEKSSEKFLEIPDLRERVDQILRGTGFGRHPMLVPSIKHYVRVGQNKDCTNIEEITAMKRDVLKMSMKVDARSAHAASALGRLWLRTPDFFIEANLIEAPSRPVPRHLELPEPLCVDIQHINNCYRKASDDLDGSSIIQLLAILLRTDLPLSLHDHICNMAIRIEATVKRRDAARRRHILKQSAIVRQCALTTNWPSQEAPHPNGEHFLLFLEEFMNGNVLRSSFQDLVAYLHQTQRKKRHIPDDGLASVDEDIHRADFSEDHEFKSLSSGRKALIQSEISLLERNYKKLASMDEKLYMSPHVADFLCKMVMQGLVRIKTQTDILHDSAGSSSLTALAGAEEICRLASHRKELALEALCYDLLPHKNWLVRRKASIHTVSLLGELDLTHRLYGTLLKQVAANVSGNVDESDAQRSVSDATAEQFMEEKDDWDAERHSKIVQGLRRRVELDPPGHPLISKLLDSDCQRLFLGEDHVGKRRMGNERRKQQLSHALDDHDPFAVDLHDFFEL